MLKSSKISIAIFFLLLIGLSAYAFIFFRDRNSSPRINTGNGLSQTSQSTQDDQSATVQSTANTSITDNSAVDTTNDATDNENTPDEKNNYLDVSKTDCQNQCKDFTDPEDLKYCQEICGLTAVKKDIKEKNGCDALKDLEKDYCLKDLAITKKDLTICQNISDSNIQKACRNRIAEDLVGSQN